MPGYAFVGTSAGTIAKYQINKKDKTFTQVSQFATHIDGVRSMKLHPKKKVMVSGSRDGSVRLWD